MLVTPARRRRRVADGRVAAQPGRRASWPSTRRSRWPSFHAALADLTDADVIGSAYCIRALRGRRPLRWPRPASPPPGPRWPPAGVQLLVDFVPNHVAPDHPWLVDHPRALRAGSRRRPRPATRRRSSQVGDADRSPAVATRTSRRGRTSPSSTRSRPALRDAAAATLVDIGSQADGVRCDMAMLMLNDVFQRTWGGRAGAPPATEYWTDVIGRRARRPPRLPVRRRGLLGPGVGPPAARLRPLLRQAALRPAAARRRRGRCAVTSHADLDYQRGLLRFAREPRRAARRGRAGAGARARPPPW